MCPHILEYGITMVLMDTDIIIYMNSHLDADNYFQMVTK